MPRAWPRKLAGSLASLPTYHRHRGGAALSGLVALDCDIEFIGWDVCDAARQMLSSFNTASIRTSQADTFS
jgi:hypothetical protein